MEVVGYNEKYKNDFIEMNKAWIEKLFVLEKTDIDEFNDIEKYIERGGEIFFALEDDVVLACCMIAPRDDGDCQIMKFAGRNMGTGKKAGSMCLKACIDYAKQKNVEKILIVTNPKCERAVHLYRKFGFVEIPVDRNKFPFKRSALAFEMDL